jgi:N-hydroxyarylamine O-acetyltransferase
MSDTEFDLSAYLARIGLSELCSSDGGIKGVADIALLQRVHRAQALTIPFENFDICLQRPIKLDSQSLQQKLVSQRRGGYCFEVNGLLLIALQALGFEARALLCRVHTNGQFTGHTHQIC